MRTTERLYGTYFGNFSLRRDDQPLCLGRTRSVLETCRYLIARAGQSVARDELLELLWPGVDPRLSGHRLHVAISTLRSLLAGGADGLVQCDGQHYVFAADAVTTDFQLFEEHYQRGARAFRDGERRAAWTSLEAALALYTADYLQDNLYAEWTTVPRNRYATYHLEALMLLCEQARHENDYATLLQFAHRVIERDPLRERAHRHLMVAQYRLGQRAVAMRQFDDCARVVSRELGARPSRETQLLYQAIRDDATLPVEPPLSVERN